MKMIGPPPEDTIDSTQVQPGNEVFNDEEVLREKLISLRKQDQAEQALRIEQGPGAQPVAVVEKVTDPVVMASKQPETAPNPLPQDVTKAETGEAAVDSEPDTGLLSEQLWVRVPFKSGFTTLDKKMVKALTDIAGKYLAEPREQTLVIRGFCDGEPIGGYNRGKHKSRHAYNSQLALSQSRARYVADIMIKAGVQAEVVKVEGYGDTHFIADNKTAEGRDRNRRVDVFLLGK